jgi:hypothetical protein
VQMKLLGITSVDFDIVGQCQILEKRWEYNGAVHQPFIDFKNAYDLLGRKYCTIF